MLHALIMAGGSGTRFWPASRADRPKQLLTLTGERSMIQATVDRLGDWVSPERTLIVTNERLVRPIREQLPQLPEAAVVGEPCKRDTAPCVGLAAAMMLRDDPDATMVVMPADHVIQDHQRFRQSLAYAAELVEQQPQRFVTFGIRPTYPAESFGYIERGETMAGEGLESKSAERTKFPTFAVSQFREKPTRAVAEEYLATGRFYWNAGIFVWKAAAIMAALEKFEPVMAEHIRRIGEASGRSNFASVLRDEFAAIQGKSIDFAVMERYSDVAVIEAPFDWDDVGSWQALSRIGGADEDGNTTHGRQLNIRSRGNIVHSSDEHLIVTLGMQDCIIVHTPDATLVANKNDEEAVREAVKLIEQRGWHEYL
ncbi:MAG: mannose-1-phosphate guanylyltransferase [Planctomycetales bacterium]|nr:mannose-1-phosphate guanylyltransferase [Planctomycetales bacterium]